MGILIICTHDSNNYNSNLHNTLLHPYFKVYILIVTIATATSISVLNSRKEEGSFKEEN